MRIIFFFNEILSKIKWFSQRRIRKHGCADVDLWNLDYHLATIILPKLIAFRKSNIKGYPYPFFTWDNLKHSGEYKNKRDYQQAIKKGDIVGGGFSKWLAAIDEMIFGFEFLLADMGHPKIEKQFKSKYGDWTEEIEKNKHVLNLYEEDDYLTTAKTNKLASSDVFYIDREMHNKFSKRAQKGLEIFGKYFYHLSD